MYLMANSFIVATCILCCAVLYVFYVDHDDTVQFIRTLIFSISHLLLLLSQFYIGTSLLVSTGCKPKQFNNNKTLYVHCYF